MRRAFGFFLGLFGFGKGRRGSGGGPPVEHPNALLSETGIALLTESGNFIIKE